MKRQIAIFLFIIKIFKVNGQDQKLPKEKLVTYIKEQYSKKDSICIKSNAHQLGTI